jgi:hypothetical protein
MNHYYDFVAQRKLALIGNGSVFTEKEAERIVAGTPNIALEAFVKETDGLTPEYIQQTNELYVGLSPHKTQFWKEYFRRFALEKERTGSCIHPRVLVETRRKISRISPRREKSENDIEDLICSAFELVRFMTGGKTD